MSDTPTPLPAPVIYELGGVVRMTLDTLGEATITWDHRVHACAPGAWVRISLPAMQPA